MKSNLDLLNEIHGDSLALARKLIDFGNTDPTDDSITRLYKVYSAYVLATTTLSSYIVETTGDYMNEANQRMEKLVKRRKDNR